MVKVLVVGGTGFLGSAITREAVARGDDVAVLSRRPARDVAMPGIEILTGDRHDDLSVLRGHRFDLVFDTCGYAPDAIDHLLDALGDFDGRYVFISSASVYGDYSRPGLAEDADVPRATAEQLALTASLPLIDRAQATAYGKAYGPLKRECECVALKRLGHRALILRSGLLVGAGDYTDRLTWWLRRIDEGGRIPVPGPPDRSIQLIDVRDAAAFASLAAAKGLQSIYNVTGRPIPLATILETTARTAGTKPEFCWIDQRQVTASGIKPWTEVPLFLPADGDTYRHFFEIDVEKAHAAGLRHRPVDETLADILIWDRQRRDQPMRCGMTRAQEGTLLDSASS